MSYFPPSALTKRQPASRHTGGKEMEFQLDVKPDYHEQSAESNKKHRSAQLDYHTRNPRVKNPQDLENIVPESEREGYNEDGISRKLAWLARNGYTVHTYEEMLTARVPAPQIPRRERRRLLIERRKVIFENQRFEREQAEAAAKGPATTMVPRSESAYKPPKYRPPPTSPFTRTPIERHRTETPSPMTYSGSSRHSSVAPVSPAPLPQGYIHPQFDASQWMDETFGSSDSSFAPEAGLPPDPRAMMAEVNELFTQEEQVVYGFIPSGYEQLVGGQPDPFWQAGLPPQAGQAQYSGGMVVPEFPNYPGGSSYHPSQYGQ